MKPNKQILALLFVGAITAWSSSAKADSLFGADGNDRCGLGSLIFKGDSISTQSSENSLNGIMSNELISVTTGTSGCSNSGLVQNISEQQMHYASINLEEIMMQMAQGQGEVLSGFAHSFGCTSDMAPRFNEMSQKNFSNIVPRHNISPAELIERTKEKIHADPVLATGCQA